MSNRRLGIYMIENLESGKVYIGSSVHLKRRIQDHKSALCRGAHQNPHLQSSWDKYGEIAFIFEHLEYLDDPEKLHLAEQSWIDIYRLMGIELYNVGLVARCPMIGYKPTEETRRKLSAAHKGKQPCLGHKLSDEHKRKISEARKGQQPTLGHKYTDEQRQKLSEIMTLWWAKRKGE